MQFSVIILALAVVVRAAVVPAAETNTLARRETCANVTAKLQACLDACDSSDWECPINCSIVASGEYVTCTGE